MTVQCLYQNDPKDAAAVLGQRNACRRAANKLGWLIQQERICDASEGTPLLLRPDVQELLRDVEQAALAKAGLDETAQIGLSCCGISVKRQKTSVSILICAGPWKR